MSMQAAEPKTRHIGKTKGAEDHDYDLIHELSKRLNAVWRVDQYISNADGQPELQQFWRETKSQEQKTVQRRKDFVATHCEKGCF